MTLLKLFFSFLQIGLFSIGGGYASMPLIQEQVVNINKWLSAAEFADVVTIAEMTPGPISLNAASFIGTRIAGISGAVTATVGCILPSCIIVSVLAVMYAKYRNLTLFSGILRGLRPAVVGLIAAAAFTIVQLAFFNSESVSLNNINLVSVVLFIAAFVVIRRWKVSPIIIMCASGAAGGIIYSIIEMV